MTVDLELIPTDDLLAELSRRCNDFACVLLQERVKGEGLLRFSYRGRAPILLSSLASCAEQITREMNNA